MTTPSNFQNYSLGDWESKIAAVYGSKDAERPITEIWLLQVEAATKLAEYLRRYNIKKALKQLAIVFALTCRLVRRCRVDDDIAFKFRDPDGKEITLSAMVWRKYPYVCSTCANRWCICTAMRTQEEESPEAKEILKSQKISSLNRARENIVELPKTLDGFTQMFNTIYASAHYEKTLEALGFHFMEEIGELSEAIRVLRDRHTKTIPPSPEEIRLRENLEDEIADIFSWIHSLMIKLDWLQYGELSPRNKLSDLICQVFKRPEKEELWCPECQDFQCEKSHIPMLEALEGLSETS